MTDIRYSDVASNAWSRYCADCDIYEYTGILAMYAALDLGCAIESRQLIDTVLDMLRPFWSGQVAEVGGAFGPTLYRFGGNASAYAVHKGLAPKAKKTMLGAAELLMTKQLRDENGAFCMCNWINRKPGLLWIDSVFGVCPVLLWTGLDNQRPDLIDEAVRQMRFNHERLFDRKLGLYHQAYNFLTPGVTTPGYWSRGMGWGMIALADLAAELPDGHEGYAYIYRAFNDAVNGCLAYQDKQGMWHQTMEDFGSYEEFSGSAQILYSIGKGIAAGTIERRAEALEAFKRGIKACNGYVTLDGSVFNCCIGCCAPGYSGTSSDYAVRPWLLNDTHAFGPAIMAFTQGERLHRAGIIPALAEL